MINMYFTVFSCCVPDPLRTLSPMGRTAEPPNRHPRERVRSELDRQSLQGVGRIAQDALSCRVPDALWFPRLEPRTSSLRGRRALARDVRLDIAPGLEECCLLYTSDA